MKSIRKGKANLQDAFCFVEGGELFLKNMFISPYEYGSYTNHSPTRIRKLLLQKIELRKIATQVKEKGVTLVPLRLFVNDRGLAKLEIALAKGKKLYDKREAIKRRDQERDLRRHGT